MKPAPTRFSPLWTLAATTLTCPNQSGSTLLCVISKSMPEHVLPGMPLSSPLTLIIWKYMLLKKIDCFFSYPHQSLADWCGEKLSLSFFTFIDYYSSYPFGLLLCHLQESSHISLIPFSASQPNSSFALVASE